MKKIISFIFSFFVLAGVAYADGAVVSYVTDNLILTDEKTETEIPDDELYDYNLVIANNAGAELLNVNIYSFVSMTELFNDNSVSFQCGDNTGSILKLYKDGVMQRKFSIDSLTDGVTSSVVIADKKLSFTGTESEETICINVKVEAASDNPADYINAQYSSAEKRLYVEGYSFQGKGRPVTIILTKADSPFEISHIEQAVIDYNGDFKTDFKFTEDIDKFVLNVVVDEALYAVDVVIDDTPKEQKAVLSGTYENNRINVTMDINNAFIGNNKTSKIVAAFYDENGVFVSCRIGNNFDTKLKESLIPENAAKIKIFALDLINGIKPQTSSVEILLK